MNIVVYHPMKRHVKRKHKAVIAFHILKMENAELLSIWYNLR